MVLKNQRRVLIVGINFSVLLVVLMFQACGKDYGTVSLQTVGLPPKCRTGNCITSQINPDIDVVRPPTKVLFVVDNSRTMKLSQSYLANGVTTLAKDLRGFDADFYIYSTSDSHQKKIDIDGNQVDKDDKPVIAASPLKSCKWTETIDGTIVEKTGGDCPNNDKTEYTSELINLLNPSLSPDLNFRATYSESELNQASDKLAATITGVGVDGSSSETGLCSLVRSVYNDSANTMFRKGDNAAMVIMSDEDDASEVSKCLSRTTQKEAFVGRAGETQSCNPATEKCDAVDYKVDFSSVTQTTPYTELKANYQCNTVTNGSCGVNGGCTKVTYNYNNLGSKILYSCLNKVNYVVNFNSVANYSRSLNYSCFSRVPYTISFNNTPTYSQTMSYQCEQLEDGVPVATSTPKILDLNNSVAACTNGAEIVCDAPSESLAASKCTTGTRLLANSCKLKCVVGSKAEANGSFDDRDAGALGRDLITTGFSYNSNTYSNLYEWTTSGYSQYSVKSNGIVRGAADITTPAATTLAGLNSICTNGEMIDCDSSQLQQATNSCGSSSKKVVPGSCKVKCVATSTPSSVTYSDLRSDADLYDLKTTSFTDPSNSTVYSNLTDWGNARYSPKTVSSVTRSISNTTNTEKFIGANCSASNTVGVDCSASDLTWAASSLACNGKKVMLCKRKCIGEAKSLVLPNVSEDKANFCSNSDTSLKFIKPLGSTPEFSSIQDYATATINPGQTATITGCTRVGDGYTAVAQAALAKTVDSKTCAQVNIAGSFSADWTGKCVGLSPKQNGISSGSTSYSCLDKNRSVELKPALSKTFTYVPTDKENICSTPLRVGATNYNSLKEYLMSQNGRDDQPSACSATTASKTVVPAGVVSVAKSTFGWSFPKTVLADSPEANLEKAFVSRSTELFGENGFFVSAIIRDPIEDAKEANCAPLGADQSIGVKYRSLVDAASAKSTSAKGDVTSICSTDYSKALESVSHWIKENAKRTVFMPDVKEENEILSVWLFSDKTGEELRLVEGKDFEIVGNKVNFINPSIDPKGWLIKYIYWAPFGPTPTPTPTPTTPTAVE